MEPTRKSPAIRDFLQSMTGRTTAIEAMRCIDVPFGCGQEVGNFRDEISLREYRISGLCQTCQDSIFSKEEE